MAEGQGQGPESIGATTPSSSVTRESSTIDPVAAARVNRSFFRSARESMAKLLGRGGGEHDQEPEGSTVDPTLVQHVAGQFQDEVRRSAATIAAKRSIPNPTKEDIQGVADEMDDRASRNDAS